MNNCLHTHRCTACHELRDCTKPECQAIFYHDVCPTPCQPTVLTPARQFGLGKTTRRVAVPRSQEHVA